MCSWFRNAMLPPFAIAWPHDPPQFIQLYQHNAAAVAQELLQGLSAPQAFTSPKYLYDALGSRLFEAITELPEYDLTRTEAQLMRLHSADMALHMPAGA